jgi:hypothetical protein
VSNADVRFGSHPGTPLLTFAPNVQHHAGNPGDARKKELWDLWGGVAEDAHQYRRAMDRVASLQHDLAVAESEVERLGNKLRSSHGALTQKLGVPVLPVSKQERGE